LDLGIAGKVAIVAGAGQGVALAAACELGREGARIVLADPDAERLQAAIAAVRATGAGVDGVVADPADRADAARIAEQARQAHGGADILILEPPPNEIPPDFSAITDDDLRAVHRQWNMGLVHLAREVLPHMRARRWGRIVMLSSSNPKEPELGTPRYGDNLRVGAAAIAKTLAHEFATDGVTVNVIALGEFETGDGSPLRPSGANRPAMRRSGRPEEASALALFLCSERASYLTGEIIRLDGGRGESIF
jgi:3-oxoacyl-[acyl-carrier protein] reductase